ncbi:MAG: YfaZ family protein [Gammaproteobacteria bacterium]|nr:YfaZ family protein [Gammaproteobacteria bacterium]
MSKVKLSHLSSLVMAFVFIWNTTATAQTASITLSESSAQLGYSFLVGGSNYGRTEVGMDFLYNDEDAYIADASLLVFDEVGSKMRGLVAGLGGKAYGASVSDQEYLALGVGGMIRFALPQNKRVIFGVDGYYAPPIVSFLNADRFYEAAGRLEYEVLPQASAFVEYRKFYVEADNGNEGSLEKGYRVGMEINF